MPVFGSDTPIGAGMLWYTNTAPAGWLIADGSSLNRADYPKLFSVIGTTYGSASGTTFNVPDLRQRFPMGKAASGTGNSLAGTGGSVDHTHSVPAHYHGMGTGADLNITASGSGTTGTDSPDHTHLTFSANDTANAALSNARAMSPKNEPGTSFNTELAGSNAAAAVGKSGGASTTHTHSTPTHTHASGNIAGRIGLVTGGVDGNSSMTSGTQNPPYLVVNYIIKHA